MTPEIERKGTLAVITGASRGIGAELIRTFAAGGYDIVTYARHKEDLQALRDEVINRFGVDFHFQIIDAADVEEVRAFGAYVKELGKPDRKSTRLNSSH